jgi:hypothetical protein
MGYSSKEGKRPFEMASKSSHSHIINDTTVKALLERCNIPKQTGEAVLPNDLQIPFSPVAENPIRHIIAIDGGYTEVPVKTEYPSSAVAFFQIGALIFEVEDLERLGKQAFIDPEDMARLNRIQRLKLCLPIRGMSLKDEDSLTSSVRRALFDFFCTRTEDGMLVETLAWFVFEEYRGTPETWNLASCPSCERSNILLERSNMTRQFTFSCPFCDGAIYLTDVFRLHERVDDELGASGILGYVSTTVEQLVLVHLIRLILKQKPALLQQVLFVKDGPLAFFGPTASMHKPMRALVRFLLERHNLFLAGLEKSGAFVEHADQIQSQLKPGSILLLDNQYIYTYIIPGKDDPNSPYGRSSYYSNKLVFKAPSGGVHVVSLPTTDVIAHPAETDFPNIQAILTNIDKLKCDMYDNALFPIALVNKLVSLANHPSSRILQRFAIEAVQG